MIIPPELPQLQVDETFFAARIKRSREGFAGGKLGDIRYKIARTFRGYAESALQEAGCVRVGLKD